MTCELHLPLSYVPSLPGSPGTGTTSLNVVRAWLQCQGERLPVAFSLALSCSAAALAESQPNRPLPSGTEIQRDKITAELPRGWSEIKGPTSRIIYPAPVFAVASDPAEVPKTLRACHPPDAILSQLPPDGVLIEVLEATPKGMDGRPAHIKLDRKSFDTYECSGPSHSITFHEHGRGLYIHVWFNQDHVSATKRSDAVDFLNSIDVGVFGSGECPGGLGAKAEPELRRRRRALVQDAAHKWADWIVPAERMQRCPSVFANSHAIRATDRIACQAVERFVLEDFAPHPGGWIERSSRFDCRITESTGKGGIGVDCVDTDRGPEGPHFRFRFF